MPRRGNIAKRDVLADPIYNSKMVTRLVNSIMLDGKKGVAQKIVYEAFDIVKEKTGNDPLEMFEKALENIMPTLECKTTYSRARGEKTMSARLAGEIVDATNNTGSAVKKREDTHKMAEANRAFAHYRY